MTQHIYQVDAFTRTPFTGNPAAVCVLPEPASERWMQDVAREMNLSETAFLVECEDGYSPALVHPDGGSRPVRPRNPRQRACAMGNGRGATPEETIRFHTRSGTALRRSATAIGSS